ncbi:hypothetical protein I3W98_41795, partial [Streptomyces cavourensis]|nr:hypothetical protein [Streptomyces cavourensis]
LASVTYGYDANGNEISKTPGPVRDGGGHLVGRADARDEGEKEELHRHEHRPYVVRVPVDPPHEREYRERHEYGDEIGRQHRHGDPEHRPGRA